MPTPRFVLENLRHRAQRPALMLLALTVAACGQAQSTADAGTDPDAADTSFGFETKTQDVPIVGEDLGPNADIATDGAQDTGVQTDVLSVTTQAATAVTLGATASLKVVVDHDVGPDGAPKTSETVAFLIDGKPFAAGATLAAKPKDQPAVAIWETGDAGEYLIAGVRPGTAKLVVTVDGIAAPETTVTVTWPTGPVIAGAIPAAAGSSAAQRTDEVAPDTVKVLGQTFAPGGVDATVRFPTTAANGDAFDLGSPPSKGQLSISLTVVSGAGLNLPATPVAGRLWIDQTDKGYFRGTYLGQTVEKTPVVGAFVIERDGNFGIDLLDDPVLVETSSLVTPESDLHVSRVSVNAIGNGKALLTWRRIKNVSQAEIARWVIDAKTGATVTTLPPLVAGSVGPFKSGTPDPSVDPVFGGVGAAVSYKKVLVAWEGKNGKDTFSTAAPTGIWMRGMDSDGALATTGVFAGDKPVQVGTDACNGGCSVQVLTLPNARFLVLWSPEGGGIRAQRVEGDYTFTDKNPTQLLTAPATAGRAVVSDAIMGLTWTTPTDGAFIRVFNINPTGISSSVQEMAIGTTTANAPMPGAGIFGVGAPGFLAFALDGMPANNLKMLRVDFSNTPVTAETPVETGLGAIHVQAGEDPQVLVLQQQADSTSANPLRLRKFTKTVSTDEVVQLSQVVNLGAKSSVPLVASLCYVPEADTYIAAWSGDFKSEAVYFQRFR